MIEPAADIDRELARRTQRLTTGDVDGGRTLYYGVPFRWAEWVWSDWLAREVRPMSEVFDEGLGLPVVTTTAEFIRPLVQDEVVELVLYVQRVGNSSFTIRTDVITGDGEVALLVRTVLVYAENFGGAVRSAPLPDWLRRPLLGEPT